MSRWGRAFVWAITGIVAAWFAVLPAPASVVQSSFAGGDPQGDRGAGVALNPVSGDVYVVGESSSSNFPGADHGPNGSSDPFVTRFSGDLRTLTRTVLFGGSNTQLGEAACAVAIDPQSGDVVVVGDTDATDFPGTSGGYQSKAAGGGDVFVARFTAALDLEQATYLGGTSLDSCNDVLIEPTTGDVLVLGVGSPDFPGTAGGLRPVATPPTADIFVSRLSADLRTLRQSTFLGGSNLDLPGAFAIHPLTGELVVTGSSFSQDFPPGVSGLGFVALMNTGLTELHHVTRFGGSDPRGLAFDPGSGDIYVTGDDTVGVIDGTAGGAQSTPGGGDDGFAARFLSDGTFKQATFIGGSGFDRADSIIVDPPSGDVLVWGDAQSTDLPGVATGFQPIFGGSVDGYVVRFNAALTVRKQATYVGGTGSEQAYGMVRDPHSGDFYVTGWGGDTNFPGISGGADPVGGAQDAVVVRLTIDLGPGAAGPTPSFTVTVARSPTGTPTATSFPTQSATASATASASATGAATATTGPTTRVGDCNGDGAVTIGELITGVNIALGVFQVNACTAMDANRDGQIKVNELVLAVGAALQGFPGSL